MKQNKLFIGLATIAAVLTFASCSSDEQELMSQPSKARTITFTTSLSTTRATSDPQAGTSLSTGSKLAIFAINGTGTLTNGNNEQYSVDGSGNLSPKTTDNTMTWPTEGAVNFYAYAPYNSEWSTSGAQTFTVSNDQSDNSTTTYLDNDLVWASATNKTSSDAPIALQFSHKLSKVSITLSKTSDSDVNLSGATVSITNTLPTTTLNLTTGEVPAQATGTARDILAATLSADLTAGEATSTATAYAIVAPQSLSAGTEFVKIVTTDNKTLIGKLSTAATLVSGNSYNMNISVGKLTAEVTTTEISFGSANLVEWNDNTIGLTAYTVGDFVLADGSCIKASQITDANKSNIAGVIFSTTVSQTDRTAGYNAYAMGLTRMKNRTCGFETEITAGPTSLADGIADLDGRTKTSAVVNSTAYSTYAASNTNHVATLSSYTPALTGTNLSGWFVPSFGQVVQMLNNLGEANITESTITANSFGTNSSFYVYNNDNSTGKVEPSTIISNFSTYVVTKAGKSENIITAGNITIATISESESSKFWTFALTSDGNSWELGAAAGKTSSTNRSVIPCFAVTLPAVAN